MATFVPHQHTSLDAVRTNEVFRLFTKVCSRCQQSKSVADFWNCRSTKDGLLDRCKACQALANKDLRDAKRRLVFEYLEKHPCVDCGESDPIVLQFDHITGIKVDSIASMVSKSRPIELIFEEIAKCAIRCANCHRRKTVKQFNHLDWLGGP